MVAQTNMTHDYTQLNANVTSSLERYGHCVCVECRFEQAPNPNLIITRSCLFFRFKITHPESWRKTDKLIRREMKTRMSFYSFHRSKGCPIYCVWCECQSHSSIDLFGDLLRHSITHTSLASWTWMLFMHRWQKTIRIWLQMDYFDAQAAQRDRFTNFVNLGKCPRQSPSVLNNCFSSFVYFVFFFFFRSTDERLNPRRIKSFEYCIFPAVRRIFVQTMTGDDPRQIYTNNW